VDGSGLRATGRGRGAGVLPSQARRGRTARRWRLARPVPEGASRCSVPLPKSSAFNWPQAPSGWSEQSSASTEQEPSPGNRAKATGGIAPHLFAAQGRAAPTARKVRVRSKRRVAAHYAAHPTRPKQRRCPTSAPRPVPSKCRRWRWRWPCAGVKFPCAVGMGVLDLIAGRPVSTPHDQALAHVEHGVAISWRPGCPYTARLRVAVRAHRQRARWVNIWEDEAGRAFVASVNGGDETVPTVVIDGVPHTNPEPALVKAALSS
jgi:mycoredoxin